MFKLLIVDDEKNIRLGIQAMITRALPDTFSILLAKNGMEALQLMETEHVDILLTDIKMPEMDGIRLVESIQSQERKPAVVIISGYDDFDYAKKAIKYRVNDYLLKPINRNELRQTLERVMNEIKAEKDSMKDSDEYYSNQLNYIFIHPTITEGEMKKIISNLHLAQFLDGYYVGTIKFHENKDEENNYYVKEIISKYSCGETDVNFCFNDKDGNIVILSVDESVFSCIHTHLMSKSFSMGISSKQLNLHHIKTAYEQAVVSMKSNFLFPRKSFIRYGDINHRNVNEDDLPKEMLNRISNMIGTNREQEIKASLLEVLNLEEISEQGILYMELLNKAINTIILDAAYKKLGEESIEIMKQYHKVGYIYHFESFYEYFYALEEMIFLLHEYHKQLKSIYSEQKYMDKAIKYIHENFNKDLNLAVVSNHVSLNYSYFSHMFKEYTGLNFVDYLKKVRVDQAKALLTSADLKIYEVSNLVGYKNPKQFTRVFREFVGIAPKEYQEKQ